MQSGFILYVLIASSITLLTIEDMYDNDIYFTIFIILFISFLILVLTIAFLTIAHLFLKWKKIYPIFEINIG
ncbi:hypothetical protein R0J91_19225, partial [Micrococcus sp. SIMBA_131]